MNLTYTIEDDDIDLWTDEDIEKENCTFNGWYDNEGLTGDPVTSIPAGSTGNKEFWAKWTENITTYSVSVAVDGTGHGTAEATATEVQPGGNVTVTYTADTYQDISNEAVAGFYDFVRWSDGNTENPRTISGVSANINLTAVTALKTALELRDDMKDDYYEAMEDAYDGQTVKRVQYMRNFVAGQWAAFSLPFDLEIEDTELDGKVYAYTGATGNADEGLNVNFAKNGSAIEAGKPYLFYSSIGMSSVTIEPAGGLTISKGAGYEDGQTGSVRFTATNRRTPLAAGDKSVIFLNNNHLYYPNSVSGNTMRPFRGYFKVDGAMGVMPRLRIVTGGQTVTEIEGVTESGQQTGARKYIEDGRLVIEREGVRYDATGAKIN